MSSDSKKLCPVLPSSLNRTVSSSALAAVGVGIGTYVSLRNSDLKVLGGWDLQKNKYFVPATSVVAASLAATTVGFISYMLSNRN